MPATHTTETPAEPRQRNADRTRLTILAAALDEFARHGLGGARVDRIAEKAGIDKRLIYYYFSNKDDLFLAVLEQAYAQIRLAEQELHLTALAPAEAIRQLTAFTWNYYLEHPEFLTLLNSENLHLAVHLKRSTQIRKTNWPLVETLGEILERGRADGSFRGGVDPIQMYISIAGLSYFYLSNRNTLSVIFDRDLMSAKARSERLSHVTEVVMGYLLRD